MKYKIYDDYLNNLLFKKIKNVLNSNVFPWYIQSYITGLEKDNNYNYYFAHTFFDNEKINSDYFHLWEELILKTKIKKLIRIKANLYNKTENIIEHTKHTDYDFNGKTSIYYINTNNGYTNLDNKINVKSIKNRFLIFNNNIPHNSTTCTDEKYRLTVVINYI